LSDIIYQSKKKYSIKLALHTPSLEGLGSQLQFKVQVLMIIGILGSRLHR
jgi:hypothetical protein